MKLDSCDLLIAFDTEYVTEDINGYEAEFLTADPELATQKGNKVVCISYAIYHPATGRKFSGLVNIPPKRKLRWTLKQFLERVLHAAVEAGILEPRRLIEADDRRPKRRRKNLRIILAGHFSRADLPGFADFRKLKKRFSAVRKTYTTISTPYVLTARPGNFRPALSVTLRDTRLLTPEGFGRLSDIGNMLGRQKLTVPDVVNEKGETVRGITRMDLVQARHPAEFREYAVRDAELTLGYLLKVGELTAEMHRADVPATIGALSVRMFRELATDFAGFMGRVPDPESKGGRKLVMNPALEAHAGIWGNAYRGGRNEGYAHGVFKAPEGRVWNDLDLASAYVVAMADIPPIDWDNPTMPTRIEDIATMDAATVAHIKFAFPPETRFPCLPVPAGSGLLFPMAGETTTTGIEILAALNMGATVEIITAMRMEFLPGVHEYEKFAKTIADFRARYRKANPLFEKLVKTAGNSLYGKVSQAIAGMRSIDPDRSKMFDTLTGDRQELPPSPVSNPVHAAMITATIRAVVSEIISSLPEDRTVLSVTTDGFLTDATLEEALEAAKGPIASRFRQALDSVLPGKSLLEIKHQALEVAVVRTRGAFTVAAPEGYTGEPILARAGHKLEEFEGDDWQQAAEFVRIFRERGPETRLLVKDFISVEDQWLADADLISIPAEKKVNFDYDMGGVPVGVEEVCGLLRFTTRPWPNKVSYEAARKAHADLRKSGGQLKAMGDWKQIEAKVMAAAGREPTGSSDAALAWVRSLAALELCGTGKPMTLSEGAAAITELGLPTTPKQMLDAGKKARVRGMPTPPATLRGWLLAPNSISKHGATVLEHAKTHILQGFSCPKLDGANLYKGVGEHTPFGTIPLVVKSAGPDHAEERWSGGVQGAGDGVEADAPADPVPLYQPVVLAPEPVEALDLPTGMAEAEPAQADFLRRNSPSPPEKAVEPAEAAHPSTSTPEPEPPPAASPEALRVVRIDASPLFKEADRLARQRRQPDPPRAGASASPPRLPGLGGAPASRASSRLVGRDLTRPGWHRG